MTRGSDAGNVGAGGSAGVRVDRESTRVLVLEDEPQTAGLYYSCLTDAGYDVQVAHTVDEALEMADDSVDVALLDRRLPDGEGADVLETIRDRGHDIRVAMVTAVEPDFDIIEMGFDLYLLKPVPQARLIEAVETLRTRREYDEKLRETAALVAKRAILQVEKEPAALQANADYQRLLDRIDDLDADLDDLTEDFTAEDYKTLFREIGRA